MKVSDFIECAERLKKYKVPLDWEIEIPWDVGIRPNFFVPSLLLGTTKENYFRYIENFRPKKRKK